MTVRRLNANAATIAIVTPTAAAHDTPKITWCDLIQDSAVVAGTAGVGEGGGNGGLGLGGDIT